MTSNSERYISHHLGRISRPTTVRHNALAALEHHGRHFPPNKDAAILEVGPGLGALLACLRDRCGYSNVKALDLSPEVVTVCNEVLPGSTVLVKDTADFLRKSPEQFDLILMLHVVEHIPKDDITPTLDAARSALKKDGKLIVEVPNIAHPITGKYNRYHDFTHTTGFTDESLAFVLRDAGFEKLTVYGCRMPRSSPVRLVQRTFQDAVELLGGLVLRIYLPSMGVNLATAIAACATK